MLTVPDPPPPPPAAVITPLLIVIVVPSTFTVPETVVDATGRTVEITPLDITILDPSILTAPILEVVAVGNKELEIVPVRLETFNDPDIVVAFNVPLTVKTLVKLSHSKPCASSIVVPTFG